MSVAFSLMKAQMPLLLIIVHVLVQKLVSLTVIEITPDAEAKYLIVLLLQENRDQTHSYSENFAAQNSQKRERKKVILDYCICKIISNIYDIIKTA